MRVIALGLCLVLASCGDSTSPTPPSSSTQPSPKATGTGPTVFIGDSITAYWPLPEGVINAGEPDDTSAVMLARFDRDVLALHPSMVVILAGTNDIRHVPNPDLMNIFAMVEEAESAGAKVIVGTLPPINDWGPGMPVDATQGNDAVREWNLGIRNSAFAYGYDYADYFLQMVNPDGTQNATLFRSDHLHPDAAGYAVMWPIVSQRLHGN